MVLTPFRCSGPKQFDQSLLNTHTRAHTGTHRHMHTLLFCKATLVLWRCHPSASFLIQTTLESVLLRFLLSDAREGGRFTAVWEDLGCWRDLGSAGVVAGEDPRSGEGGSAVCSPPFELKGCAVAFAKRELEFLGVFVTLQCFAPVSRFPVSPGNRQLNSPKAVRA